MNSEDIQLRDELADALREMVDLTCPSMLPLWLEATKRLRGNYFDAATPELPAYLKRAMSDSSRSKYKALAKWRHCVVWQSLLVDDPEVSVEEDNLLQRELGAYAETRPTLQAIYFSPCDDTPPYSFSQKKSDAPTIDMAVDSEDLIIRRCVRAAWTTVKIIEARWKEAEGGPVSAFLESSAKKALKDVLKFTEFSKKPGNDKYIWPVLRWPEEV
ncbi:hypothetical protein FRC98_18835 [Lujinxingia vulgaris]|uniref:Uncharacterized protein n=1 Tax=Lujinxingia vulgaris TaxID=2600176 RepID=A0A5C6X3X4_9DELT|nr:hypothetical protein [Lujinxingia vulgaris]TXD34252.1 hypothetical protein FRC98_18835 [Lujinxingia vulgaris]